MIRAAGKGSSWNSWSAFAHEKYARCDRRLSHFTHTNRDSNAANASNAARLIIIQPGSNAARDCQAAYHSIFGCDADLFAFRACKAAS